VKQLVCRDAGFDCDAVVRAESDEEVMAQVRPHAQQAHDVTVTPEMEQQFTALVRQA
jgi:predicted small metal-binding protein